MLSLPRFGARRMAAGKHSPPSWIFSSETTTAFWSFAEPLQIPWPKSITKLFRTMRAAIRWQMREIRLLKARHGHGVLVTLPQCFVTNMFITRLSSWCIQFEQKYSGGGGTKIDSESRFCFSDMYISSPPAHSYCQSACYDPNPSDLEAKICASEMLEFLGQAKISENRRKNTTNLASFVRFSLSLLISLAYSRPPRCPGRPQRMPCNFQRSCWNDRKNCVAALAQTAMQHGESFASQCREREMNTNLFLHKLSEHPQGSGNIPGTSQVLYLEAKDNKLFKI